MTKTNISATLADGATAVVGMTVYRSSGVPCVIVTIWDDSRTLTVKGARADGVVATYLENAGKLYANSPAGGPGYECSRCGNVFPGEPARSVPPGRNSDDGLPATMCPECDRAWGRRAAEMDAKFPAED